MRRRTKRQKRLSPSVRSLSRRGQSHSWPGGMKSLGVEQSTDLVDDNIVLRTVALETAPVRIVGGPRSMVLTPNSMVVPLMARLMVRSWTSQLVSRIYLPWISTALMHLLQMSTVSMHFMQLGG